MNRSHFDVIVVGGGPAGSMTAYFLAKAGVRTALIDGSVFPRSKPCGGGLQARTLADLPFDLSHLFRGTMNRLSVSFGLSESWTRAYPEPLVYNVLRSEFDHYLIRRAEAAGASVYQGSPLRGLIADREGLITVMIDSGALQASVLVGADGANSVVRGLLNDRRHYFWQAAVSCEVPEEYVNWPALQQDCMMVDWGTLPCGYAWAFPKHGYLNIGAGGPVRIARNLKRYVARFIDKRQLLKPGSLGRLNLVGHQLPTFAKGARLAGSRMLLVGDAAGLVEPFTGDGISFACRSARIASDCIHRALNSGHLDLRDYHTCLTSRIGDDLLWSRKLLSLSAAFPRVVYRLFRSNDRVWQTFCKTVRGEESFYKLKKDVLGQFEFAWKAIDLFMQLRERNVFGFSALAFPRKTFTRAAQTSVTNLF